MGNAVSKRPFRAHRYRPHCRPRGENLCGGSSVSEAARQPHKQRPCGEHGPKRGWGPSTERWGCPMRSVERRCPPPQPRRAALGPLIPPRCRGNDGIQRRSDLTAWQTSNRDRGRGTASGGGAERGGRGGCCHPSTDQPWGGAAHGSPSQSRCRPLLGAPWHRGAAGELCVGAGEENPAAKA